MGSYVTPLSRSIMYQNNFRQIKYLGAYTLDGIDKDERAITETRCSGDLT